MKLLQKLRNQPETVRIRVAVIVSVVIMVIIVALWAISISGRFSRAKDATPRDARPFQVFGQIFSSGFKNVQSGIDQRNAILNNKNTESSPSFSAEGGDLLESFGQSLIDQSESQADTSDPVAEAIFQPELPNPEDQTEE